jgi:hypothetical protein
MIWSDLMEHPEKDTMQTIAANLQPLARLLSISLLER